MSDDDSGRLVRLFSGAGNEAGPDATSELKGKVALLLWGRHYEEALELLYAARWDTPDAAEISRGINLLKERLVRHYIEALGHLDSVPSIAGERDPDSVVISDEERAILHLVDGISSFSDIVHQSRLGRFETYRGLTHLVRAGIVAVSPPPAPPLIPGPLRAARAPQPAAAAPIEGLPHALPEVPTVPLTEELTEPMGELPDATKLALAEAPPAALAEAPPAALAEPPPAALAEPPPAALAHPPPEALVQSPPTALAEPSLVVPPAALAPPRRWGKPLIVALTATVIVAIGVAWGAIGGLARSLRPDTVDHPVRAERPSAPHPRAVEPAAPAPRVALAEAPAPPRRAAAPPEAPVVSSGAVRRRSRSSGRAEANPKEKVPSRESETPSPPPPAPSASRAVASPASVPPTGPGSRPAVDGSGAPAHAPDAPAAAARPPSIGAASLDDRSRPAPTGITTPHPVHEAAPGLVKSAPPSAPPSVSVATSDLAVRGALGRSVVEHALARAQEDFRACYRGRAAALGRSPAGTARVTLTIDEGGYATAISVQGGPLPGLDACLQEAAGRIRTRVHPDVGLAMVTFAVVFSLAGSAQ